MEMILSKRKAIKVLLPRLNDRTIMFMRRTTDEHDLFKACVMTMFKYRNNGKYLSQDHEEYSDTKTLYVSTTVPVDSDEGVPRPSYRFKEEFREDYTRWVESRSLISKDFDITIYDDLEDLSKGFIELLRLIEYPIIGQNLMDLFHKVNDNIDMVESDVEELLELFYAVVIRDNGYMSITV